jgi:hypothetical protein
MFQHILHDIQLLDPTNPTPLYKDNHGAVDWSNSCSTEGLRHINIHENAMREARLLGKVSIQHISGSANPADLFAKELKANCTFRQRRGLLLFHPSSFKT